MTNFDFLKNFNSELYKIGVQLEDDVIASPRAVTADATIFLETLVKDIYRLTGTKLQSNRVVFYKKIDKLYRSGEISYIYKNKLHDAYNLRSKIHTHYENVEDEEYYIALDLHRKLYHISKKYYMDYCDDYDEYIGIPDYQIPKINSKSNIERKNYDEIHFSNCIICGYENTNMNSNMCNSCNSKIENANYFMSIRNNFGLDGSFTKQDLIDYGIIESDAISLIMKLTGENLIEKKGNYYNFNNTQFDDYLNNINKYVEVASLITKFYNGNISPIEIKNTPEYKSGLKNQIPYVEFTKLVNDKLLDIFEQNINNLENIEMSMKNAEIRYFDVNAWFEKEKSAFIEGNLNEAFIGFNELLLEDYFKYKKMGMDELKIREKLHITDEIYEFWIEYYHVGNDFINKLISIKKELFINAIQKNKTKAEALKTADLSESEFDNLYNLGKKDRNAFYWSYNVEYIEKRQKSFIKHLKNSNISKAIKKSKITEKDFDEWYSNGEYDYSEFYINTTKILMDKYLNSFKKCKSEENALKTIGLSKDILDSWNQHEDIDLFKKFKIKSNKILSDLDKTNLIIEGLKNNKSKKDALKLAGVSEEEFMEIYNASKNEKSEFYQLYDMEYIRNRKNVFISYLKDNDFFTSVVKSEISIKEFNDWYLMDEKEFLSKNVRSEFYITATELLMDKYLKSRLDGMSKSDSSKNVGLSNNTIDYWIRHDDIDMFHEFKNRLEKVNVDLIIKGFNEGKSKIEVSENNDIPIGIINEYIESGRKGKSDYTEIFELYENTVIPNQLNIFLKEIKTKTFKKAIKKSHFTEKELNDCYNMGKNGDEKFRDFYESYLDFKINRYVNEIISRKSEKISLRNSNLTNSEFKENEKEIEDMIFNRRFELIDDEIMKSYFSGSHLAHVAGISIYELYDWYFKGRDGDEKFREFHEIFKCSNILPHTLAVKHALSLGVPKNKVMKKLKKELGRKEYDIWMKNDILDTTDEGLVEITDVSIKNKLIEMLKSTLVAKDINCDDDSSILKFMKKIILGEKDSPDNNDATILKVKMSSKDIRKHKFIK